MQKSMSSATSHVYGMGGKDRDWRVGGYWEKHVCMRTLHC